MKHKINELLLEQLALGEIPEDQADEYLADPDIAQAVQGIQASNENILTAYPPVEMVKRIENALEYDHGAHAQPAPRHQSLASRLFKRMNILVPALASTAALILVAGLALTSFFASRETQPYIGTKGNQGIYIYKQSRTGSEALRNYASCSEGDRLQLAYMSGNKAHGIIFSIDGNGVVSLHFPDTPRGETQLTRGRETKLPYSYVLDDAPEFEKFFFLATEREFNVQNILNLAQNLADSGKALEKDILPGDNWSSVTMTLWKTERGGQ
jgi:hypothetical protein